MLLQRYADLGGRVALSRRFQSWVKYRQSLVQTAGAFQFWPK
jgi:hypothetical protein